MVAKFFFNSYIRIYNIILQIRGIFSQKKIPRLSILCCAFWHTIGGRGARSARKKNTQVELRGFNVELRMDFSKYNIKTVTLMV